GEHRRLDRGQRRRALRPQDHRRLLGRGRVDGLLVKPALVEGALVKVTLIDGRRVERGVKGRLLGRPGEGGGGQRRRGRRAGERALGQDGQQYQKGTPPTDAADDGGVNQHLAQRRQGLGLLLPGGLLLLRGLLRGGLGGRRRGRPGRDRHGTRGRGRGGG